MKKLLALALLSTSPLMAAEKNQLNTYAKDPCSSCGTCCECEPCCVPKPKKCIDCECYTPAYYDLQCDWGASVSVDFLYWYGKESNTPYAYIISGTAGSIFGDDTQLPNLDSSNTFGTSWDPGVRVGLGYNSGCDGWDSVLRWTYFRNTRKDSASQTLIGGTGETAFTSSGVQYPYSSLGVSFVPLLIGQNLSAKWKLTFNQIDWELGRKYWLSPCFTLRPYAGVRGAWTKTVLSTTVSSPAGFQTSAGLPNLEGKITSKLWGVGILGGIQPNWHFCTNFILYSNFNAALLWGDVDLKQSIVGTALGSDEAPIDINLNAKLKESKMTPVLDLGIGVRWEETWCCDRYRTALDIGWEHHAWFEHANRIGARANTDLCGNLYMSGLVVRALFDF